MRPRLVHSVAILALLQGCSAMNPLAWWSDPREQNSQRYAGAVRYQCSAGKEFALRHAPQGREWVMVILPEREFRLDQAGAASGERYTNGRTTLTIEGDQATIEEEGVALFAACKRAG